MLLSLALSEHMLYTHIHSPSRTHTQWLLVWEKCEIEYYTVGYQQFQSPNMPDKTCNLFNLIPYDPPIFAELY